jgi:hypothetical protein
MTKGGERDFFEIKEQKFERINQTMESKQLFRRMQEKITELEKELTKRKFHNPLEDYEEDEKIKDHTFRFFKGNRV